MELQRRVPSGLLACIGGRPAAGPWEQEWQGLGAGVVQAGRMEPRVSAVAGVGVRATR